MPSLSHPDGQDHTWQILEDGLERMMNRLTEGIDVPMYIQLYTAVHDFCTQQRPVSQHSSGLGSGSPAQRGAHLQGEELYQNLITYLNSHLSGVHANSKSHKGDALISYYIKEWTRYTQAAKYINHVFRYLNRHWVKREMDEGKKNVYDIYTLHLVRWKDTMFAWTQEDVMQSVLHLVRRQRNGETIEHAQIKSIVDSFVSLGIDEADSTRTNLDVYKQYFEGPFLAETKSYYQIESREFLANNMVIEYMKKAEVRLAEEKSHVPLYLLNDIMVPLMNTCNEALIEEHAPMMRDEFQVLLNEDRTEDLGRMYKLLKRIQNGLEPLRTRFELHVKRTGIAAVAKVAEVGDALEAKQYVDALLQVHKQYADLVNKAFDADSEFVRSLDSACREFVNRNKVCESASNKSPELLSKYSDTVLKRTAKTAEDDDLETILSEIMTVFKYIDDKDVFQKFYSKMLARRLVGGTSASEDAETNMIAKLKEACGFEYTNKLQRMFQDMQTSKDLNISYKDHEAKVYGMDAKSNVDATYYILGTGFWPLSPPQHPFTPPQVIVKTYERFQAFYGNKHQGRKLTWLWQLCKGEVRANYTKSASKVPYTFQVSTYQMAILLLFNDTASDVVSYDEIAAATNIDKGTLDPSLAVFVKAKVVLPEPEDGKPASGTSYRLNHNFKNKKIKVNLNIAIKSEQKQEAEETHRIIEDDRKMIIQSAIVRIMKSRKKMAHKLLVGEALGQLSTRFKPEVKDVKKNIDVLIEKEYLERLDNDELGYLA